MDDTEKIIKHLEMIQGVINRLGHDSFLIKGWSMTILAAGIIFIARSEVQYEQFILVFLIPVFGFWILDSYFLWQERLFREIYNDIRTQKTTDFEMNIRKHKPKCNLGASISSKTLTLFYGMEFFFVVAAFCIL